MIVAVLSMYARICFWPAAILEAGVASGSPADSSRCSSDRSSAWCRTRCTTSAIRSASSFCCLRSLSSTQRANPPQQLRVGRGVARHRAPPASAGGAGAAEFGAQLAFERRRDRRATAPPPVDAGSRQPARRDSADERTHERGRDQPVRMREAALVVVHVEIRDAGRDAQEQQRRRGLRPHRQARAPGHRSRCRRSRRATRRREGRRESPRLPGCARMNAPARAPATPAAAGARPADRPARCGSARTWRCAPRTSRAVPARSRRTGTRSAFRRDRRCSRKECQP